MKTNVTKTKSKKLMSVSPKGAIGKSTRPMATKTLKKGGK